MARRFAWFDLTSPRERERQEKMYRSKMFPLGEEQRRRELALLAELIPSMPAQYSLYQLLQVKEILQSDDPAADRQDWEETNLARRLSPENRRLIFAVARSSLTWQSLEDIPDAAALRRLASQENGSVF